MVESDPSTRSGLYPDGPPHRGIASGLHDNRGGASNPNDDVPTDDDHDPESSALHCHDTDTDRDVDSDVDTDVDSDTGPDHARHHERRQLRHADRFDREVARARRQRERLERRTRRTTDGRQQRGRRTPHRSGNLVTRDQRARRRPVTVPVVVETGRPTGNDQGHLHLPVGTRRDHVDRMDARTTAVRRFASGPLHGTALALYFVLLPFVVVSKWHESARQSDGSIIRVLLVVLALFWIGFLLQTGRNVARLRHGSSVPGGGSAWLAGLVVALVALAASPPARTSSVPVVRPDTAISHSPTLGSRPGPPRAPNHRAPPTATGDLALALAARRRQRALRLGDQDVTEADVDDVINQLRDADPHVISGLIALTGEQRDGVLRPTALPCAIGTRDSDEPLAAILIGEAREPLVAFAREGGVLRVPAQWSTEDLAGALTALHDGPVRLTRDVAELVRLLATRSLHRTLVVFDGPDGELDDDLRACCVIVRRLALVGAPPDDLAAAVSHYLAPRVASPTTHAPVHVELLRADPVVSGLREPFTATLRRRCVEMVAYLALHRGEPITGERLRVRVLGRGEEDATIRTLANTATAVRRSLGVDERGPRLHPVSSSSLYVTHGLTSDVEQFHDLVSRARTAAPLDAASLNREALSLVRGEPLASRLRGFEWFLVEGHWGRLRRDGEWAALALSDWAVAEGDPELAYWALSRGRLLDPDSDALVDALTRVPRLREFGGDRSGRAQHRSVGAFGTVAMGGSSHGLGE